MFPGLEGNLRAVVAHAGDKEVAVVDEHFAVKPQRNIEGEELVNAVVGNVDEAFGRGGIIPDVADACRHLLHGAHTLQTGGNAVDSPCAGGDVSAEVKIAICHTHADTLYGLGHSFWCAHGGSLLLLSLCLFAFLRGFLAACFPALLLLLRALQGLVPHILPDVEGAHRSH